MQRIVFTCTNGHTQTLKVDGSRQWAEQLAGLADGTSKIYLVPTQGAEESIIGKCGICRAQLRSTVTEEPAAVLLGSIPLVEPMVCGNCGYTPGLEGVQGRTATEAEPSAWKCPKCETWTPYVESGVTVKAFI